MPRRRAEVLIESTSKIEQATRARIRLSGPDHRSLELSVEQVQYLIEHPRVLQRSGRHA